MNGEPKSGAERSKLCRTRMVRAGLCVACCNAPLATKTRCRKCADELAACGRRRRVTATRGGGG
jgi:hypothetical protein